MDTINNSIPDYWQTINENYEEVSMKKKDYMLTADGEFVKVKKENADLVAKEINELAVFDEWLEKKELLETAKQQFDMVDKPFKAKIKELFEKYQIRRLDNPYIQIVARDGYVRKVWRDEEIEALIERQGMKVDDFKEDRWIEPSITIKYKE